MDKKSKTNTPEKLKLIIQERDIIIFKFLDRIGYANVVQITESVDNIHEEKLQASIQRRLAKLQYFKYIKVFSTHLGNYYALDKMARLSNGVIPSIKLDQLAHHNFLTKLFFIAKDEDVISEREAIAQFKLVGREGKVPDMVINECIIEYERTKKNIESSKAVVDYWTIEQNKLLCVIYETEDIKNRYSKLMNSKTILLSSKDYINIISVINNIKSGLLIDNPACISNINNSVLDKYR
ncbi:MAG: hypothetical protein LW807_07060 [Proteobacteria bacterium]|jgi:hypothetical protein|nr:hypothetical protein [Pseudomonadota bacterium]